MGDPGKTTRFSTRFSTRFRRSDLVLSVALPLAIIVLGAAYGMDEGRIIDAFVARCVAFFQ